MHTENGRVEAGQPANVTRTERHVLEFEAIDPSQVALVGGKGAHLAELSRIEGLHVPAGFCVTTDAFKRIMAETPTLENPLDRLSRLEPDDREAIGTLSAEIRRTLEAIALPDDLTAAILSHLAQLGEQGAYAVRSSATAEDSPGASFAGQHDTSLNVVGPTAILQHLRRCWASLFTERAVTYRLKNGYDHRKVHMAVVIQRMVLPQAAGILFTADPVSGNRRVTSIEASVGLGEALVAGLVTPDTYQVHDGRLIDQHVATQQRAIRPSLGGGTNEAEREPGIQRAQVLTEEQILSLEAMGRQVEAHFGCPQDLEWCLADGTFYVVQSRPITTLYPIPAAADDQYRVYVSVGHQQMMTDAMKPLGLSIYQLTGFIHRPEAGGRLFVDISAQLATSAGRAMLLGTLGKGDPLTKDALLTLMDRLGPPTEEGDQPSGGHRAAPAEVDPTVVDALIAEALASLEELKRDIRSKSGPELFDFVLADLQVLKKQMTDPRSVGLIWAGPGLVWWLNDHMKEWLDETNVADTLSQSVPNNITSQMGLDLLDVADVIRPHPAVVDYLQRAREEDFLDGLVGLEGGPAAREAIRAFLERYGMRCAAEIDLTRPRWGEKPTTLLPMLLSNIRNFAPGESRRRFEQGRQQAEAKAQDLLSRLRQLQDGERRAEETRRKIETLRAITGYREFPKYAIVSRYYLYKQALAKEAKRLVQAGVARDAADLDYLMFAEFQEVVRQQEMDYSTIERRKAEHQAYQRLTPPRILTSEGEIIAGAYQRDHLPAEALVGMPVSRGVIEGRARVIRSLDEADLEEGDVLVTAFTDPSWTPLFVAIKGLVTEVGGLMTHGSVIAREYGLPAVVGVVDATRLIRDGQRIRVNGTDGYVEILS